MPINVVNRRNTIESAQNVNMTLPARATRVLLERVPAVYGASMQDVLLTALVQAWREWTGSGSLLLGLEGHGREELVEGVELSRTVGWFTALFPVQLEIGEAGGAGGREAEELHAVQRTLERVPQHGVGYGILRYLRRKARVGQDLAKLPQAELCFNYLG